MGGKKINRAYILENLKFLAQMLVHIEGGKRDGIIYRVIDHAGLEKAIKLLPRKDRENIEHFWGLTGGINHSKKLGIPGKKDVALLRQSDEAVNSLKTLFRIDYMRMFDKNLEVMIEKLAKKLNKQGMQISDLDAIKYLSIFLVIFQNGPKLPFEEDPLEIDTESDPTFTFDEYFIIKGAYEEFINLPDGTINVKLIHDLLDMFDIQDVLAIKKSFRIEVLKTQIPEEFRNVEIEPIYTLQQVRNLKERIFPYGCWDVTNELILGNINQTVDLKEFMKCLNAIRNDWNTVIKFKSCQRKLRTFHELRTLDVYNIGGLEFTDIFEVMFLYLERNLIDP